jgi:hypothetical protein
LPSLPNTRTGGCTADTVSAVVVTSAWGCGPSGVGDDAGGCELVHDVRVATHTATLARVIGYTATAPARTVAGAAFRPTPPLIVDSRMVRSNDPDNQQRPEQHRAEAGNA